MSILAICLMRKWIDILSLQRYAFKAMLKLIFCHQEYASLQVKKLMFCEKRNNMQEMELTMLKSYV